MFPATHTLVRYQGSTHLTLCMSPITLLYVTDYLPRTITGTAPVAAIAATLARSDADTEPLLGTEKMTPSAITGLGAFGGDAEAVTGATDDVGA